MMWVSMGRWFSGEKQAKKPSQIGVFLIAIITAFNYMDLGLDGLICVCSKKLLVRSGASPKSPLPALPSFSTTKISHLIYALYLVDVCGLPCLQTVPADPSPGSACKSVRFFCWCKTLSISLSPSCLHRGAVCSLVL